MEAWRFRMIRIRRVEIGNGRPKICVPITGKTADKILEQAVKIAKTNAELVEWRVDYTEFASDRESIAEVLKNLREILGEKIILFTFRTKKEGGEQEINLSEYLELNYFAAETGYVDLVDLELFSGEEVISCIQKVHSCNCKVILSNHDFSKTPDEKEIIRRICKMEEMGADILKIAVMPQKPIDVVTLLSATCKVNEMVKKPVVTMSMAKLGVVSRLTGGIFGSAITFGTVEQASAPGQVPVDELSRYLAFFS